MELIPAGDDEDYSVDELLDLADAHRDERSEGDRATFYAVWVDGYFEDDGERQSGVLGVSIGNTGVIAMFKPVIQSTSPIEGIARFSEQLVLVHEFGHAIGLVNNGVPLTSDHPTTWRTAPTAARRAA